MKKAFEDAKVEIIALGEDVIRTSVGAGEGTTTGGGGQLP